MPIDDPATAFAALERALYELTPVAIAVSGGVDSMTLAAVAHRALGDASAMYHAVSPAVPEEATARVQHHAARESWRLHLVDAGEFSDEAYRRNPVDRCFFCKSHLYRAIRRDTDATLLSGANLDDLTDYRPGLQAAREQGVRHPYVDVGIAKTGVRALARWLGLTDLAELPAAPCLSSRVETGIPIEPSALALIHAVERLLVAEIKPNAVRCRVRRAGIVVELDQTRLAELSASEQDRLGQAVADLCGRAGSAPFIGFAPYRMGSAFLRERADG